MNATEVTFDVNPLLLVTLGPRPGHDGPATVELRSSEAAWEVDDPVLIAGLLLASDLGRATESEILAAWRGQPQLAPVADELWAFCIQECFLLDVQKVEPARLTAYHGATRSYPFMDMTKSEAFVQDNLRMQEYRASAAPPPAEASHEAETGLYVLPAVHDNWAPTSILDRLAFVLDYTFGVRARIDERMDDDSLQLGLVFKSIPSGGARHPTDCWLATRSVDGLADGLHAYQPLTNQLALVLEDTVGLEWLFMSTSGAAISVVLGSSIERAMWRYRDPRSFRAVLVDAGHAVGQLEATANAVGMGFATRNGALAQDQRQVLESLIGCPALLIASFLLEAADV